MKKLLVLGSMLGGLVLMGAGCAGSNPVPAAQPQQGNVPAESAPQATLPPSQSTAPITQPEIRQITIASFAFAPASVTVKAGTTVKWTNNDGAPHSIISSDGQFTASAVLTNSGSYQFKFDKPGTYTYACGLHPSMSGTIVVQ